MEEGQVNNARTGSKGSPLLDSRKKAVEGNALAKANEKSNAEEETAAASNDSHGDDDGEEEEEELDDDFYNSTTSALSEERWEEMFQRLLDFKEVHGHCLVPNRYKEDLQLGAWVSGQRKNYKLLQSGSGKPTPLTEERARRLVVVGFEWTAKNPRHLMWEVRFAELKDFKANYGHAQVPIGWEQNVQLANWVSTQRQEYKNLIKGKTSRLNDKRVNMLNSLGFAWELQRGGRRRRLAVNKNNLNSPPNPPHPADREEQAKGDDGSLKFAIDDGTPVKRTPGGRKRTTLKKKVTAVDDTTKCILPGVAIMGGGNRDAPASASRPSKSNKSSSNKSGGGNKDTSGRDPDASQGRGAVMSSSSMDQQEQNITNHGNNNARFRAMQGSGGGGGGNPNNNPWQMLPNGAYQHSGHPFAHLMGGGGMGPGGFFPMAAGPFGMNGMNPFAAQGNGMAGNGMDPSQFMHGQGNNNSAESFYGGGNGMNPQEMEFRRMQMQQAAAFGCGPGMGMGGTPHQNQPPFPVMSGNNFNKSDDDNNSREGGGMPNQNRQQFGGGGMPGQFGAWGPGGVVQGNFWNENAAAAAARAQHLQAAAALSAGMDERSIHPRLAQMAMARRMNGSSGQGGEMGGLPGGGGNGGTGPNMNMMGMGMNGMGGNGMNMNNQIMSMSNSGRGRRADPPADPPASNFEMMDGAMDLKRKSSPSGGLHHMKKMRAQQGIFEDADEDI